MIAAAQSPHVEKIRYPRADAIAVTREMLSYLMPCCSRMLVAGSLRRRKASVGDIELLYIANEVPGPDPADLFGREIKHNAVEIALEELLNKRLIEPRLNSLGRKTWGPENKLARHTASGIPIDLFAATHENWWSLVVCRTGSAESNMRICQAAIELGWKWEPYNGGFTRPSQSKGGGWLEVKVCRSEQEVFEFVGLEYLEPEDRG